MFDVGYSELLLIAIVALIVVGPKELPHLLRQLGRAIGKARAVAGHFRTGVDAMIREAEMEEMHKKWSAHNQQIMAAHPMSQTPPSAASDAPVAGAAVPDDAADAPQTVSPPPLHDAPPADGASDATASRAP